MSCERKYAKNPYFKTATVVPIRRNTHNGTSRDSSRNFQRMESHVYEHGISGSNNIAPSILRPQPMQETVEESSPHTSSDEYVTGHRIIDIISLNNMMNDIYISHLRTSPKCRVPEFKFPLNSETRQGLASYIYVQCLQCKFLSIQHRLFKSAEVKRRGRPKPIINVMTGNFLVSSGISVASLRMFCTALDIPPPSERSLLRSAKAASVVITVEGEKQLEKNRQDLRNIMEHNSDT